MSVEVSRKARGAYFTPNPVTRFIAKWAIRSPDDSVLEPSCGEAEFLLSAQQELSRISDDGFVLGSLHGVEIHKDSCETAKARLQACGVSPQIHNTDFFLFDSDRQFDAVIGNPPYVRYQNFSGLARQRGLEACLRQGVRLSGLSSSWAPFVIHACSFLGPAGRLGLVLPAELLSVNYASDVRRYLLKRFSRIRLVLFRGLVFPDVQEEVVLLLGEGEGPTTHFELYETTSPSELDTIEGEAWTRFSPDSDGKWSHALLSPEHVETFRQLASTSSFESLATWGTPYLGIVTGNNKYFTLTKEKVDELALSPRDLLSISPPGSRHLRGLAFSSTAWKEALNHGARGYLFYPRKGAKLSKAAVAYIDAGEKIDVHQAYKCRVREPWWRVPLVPVPDLFLTYMERDQPRLIANTAMAAHLNSLYGIRLSKGRKEVGKDLLPIAFLNSLTMLGAEMMGRSYGGGILKLEPREADRIPVPSLDLIKKYAKGLRDLRPQLARHLRRGDLLKAVHLVDRVLLLRVEEIDGGDLAILRKARQALRERRINRSRNWNE
jgi:adenine-specific DNA methylase